MYTSSQYINIIGINLVYTTAKTITTYILIFMFLGSVYYCKRFCEWKKTFSEFNVNFFVKEFLIVRSLSYI